MKELFDKLALLVTADDILTDSRGFEPPIQLPVGLKIKVAPEHLTDEGKARVDKDGCIAIKKIDYNVLAQT